MLNKDKYAVTAELKNGKHVLLNDPDYQTKTIGYRYLTDSEVEDKHLDLVSSRFWLNAPIYQTVEDGQRFTFTIIEATPIILHRF